MLLHFPFLFLPLDYELRSCGCAEGPLAVGILTDRLLSAVFLCPGHFLSSTHAE